MCVSLKGGGRCFLCHNSTTLSTLEEYPAGLPRFHRSNKPSLDSTSGTFFDSSVIKSLERHARQLDLCLPLVPEWHLVRNYSRSHLQNGGWAQFVYPKFHNLFITDITLLKTLERKVENCATRRLRSLSLSGAGLIVGMTIACVST